MLSRSGTGCVRSQASSLLCAVFLMQPKNRSASCSVLRRHLFQSLNFIHNGEDVALPVIIGVYDALIKDSISQVVDQHLDTDVCRPRVLLLLSPRVLLFPLGLSLTVGQIAQSDILHDILDGFLDRTFTDRLATDQDVHEGGFMIHIVPIAELYPVHVSTQSGENRTRHSGLIEPRDVLSQERDQRG